MKRTSVLDDDKSNLDKIKHTFKYMFFEIVHNLILGDNFPFFIYVIFILIETLQVFYFFFLDNFSNLWKVPQWTEALHQFFSYFMIQPYLKNLTFETYILITYIIMGLIMLLLMIIIFIALKSASLGKMAGTLIILKIFFEVMNYVLFIPVLQLFFTIFNCDNTTYIHKIYKDTKCYNGNYYLHVFLCTLASIVLIVVSSLITLMFFETRFQPNNPQCKVSGRLDIQFLIFKVTTVILFTVLDIEQQRLLIVVVLSLFTTKLFHSYNKSSIYLNIYFGKLINAQQIIILWAMLMIILGLIIENTDYDGAPQLLVICCPLLISIIVVRKEYRYEIMMVDSNKFDSLDQSILLLQYLSKSICYYERDDGIASLLEGFAEYHKVICKRDDCPCSPKNLNEKRIEKFKKGIKDLTLKSQYVVLIYIVEKIYVLSLTRYPNCVELRIAHALFLYEKMQQSITALQELNLAEQEKPFLDQQFLIYRIRKIIEDQMFDSNSIHTGNEFTTENNLREIKALIEKSTQLHLDFWMKLREDIPDLGKLYEVGIRMMYIDKVLDNQWKRILKISIDIPPTLLMMYSKFLLEVKSDREEAEAVVEKLKNMQTFDLDRGKIISNVKDFSNESTALISISADDGNFSRILGLNQSCAKIFGYTKSELLDRKINVLMPNMYSQFHDFYLESFLNNNESKILNRERLVFGKHKTGYIFPFFIYVRYIPSLINGSQFFAAIKQEKYFKNVAYMIVNAVDQTVENISASFVGMFHMDQNYISKKKSLIQDIVPFFEDFKTEIFQKQGYETQVQTRTKDTTIQQSCMVFGTDIILTSNKPINLKDSYPLPTNPASALIYSSQRKDENKPIGQLYGYIIKIEPIKSEKSILQTPSEHGLTKKFQQSKFLFLFDQKEIPGNKEKIEGLRKQFKKEKEKEISLNLYQYKFIGEYTNDQNFQMSAISISRQDETYEFSQQKDDEKTPSSKIEEQSNDLAHNIKTMILISGQIYDSEEYKNQEVEEEEDGQSKILGSVPNQQEEEQEQEIVNANIYKSKKSLVQFLKDSKNSNSNSLICFKWGTALLIIFLGVISLLDYILSSELFFKVNTEYQYVIQSYLRAAESQRILWLTVDLYVLEQLNQFDDQTDNISKQKIKLNQSIIDLQQLQYNLQSASVEGDQVELITTNSVKMSSRDSSGIITTQLVDINQGTSQIIAKAIELLNQFNSESQYFISYNLLNNYYEAIFLSAKIYTSQLRDTLNNDLIIIIFIVACAFSVVYIPFIACLFSLVSENQEIIIKLFLQIQIYKVKKLVTICETFLTTIQVGEEDEEMHRDNEGFVDEDEGLDEDEEYLERRKKRKKYKYDLKNKRNFYVKFAISMILLLAYFLAHFLIGIYLQNELKQIINEIEATCQFIPDITFSNNVIRQMFIDNTFEVMNNSSYLQASSFVKNLYDLSTEIQKDHSINIQYHNEAYNNLFDSLMQSGACSYITNIILIETSVCQSYIDGIIDQSLSLALSRFIEDIRSQLQEYNNLLSNNSYEIQSTTYNFTSNQTYNKQFSLLFNDIQLNEINVLQDQYLRPIFQYIGDIFLSSLQENVDTNSTTTIAIFIVFLVILLLVYLFFWWPTANKINNEIKKTTQLIAYIPMNLIKRNKAIKEYLNKMHEIE